MGRRRRSAQTLPSQTRSAGGGRAGEDVFTSASPRCLDGGDIDLLHRHHRLKRALCLSATSRKRIGQRARGDLPGKSPAVLAPTALAFHAAIADDRVPVTVRLFLILRSDLEGKGLAVPEHRAAVETETRNAQDGELHRQHIALLAARIVTGGLVNSGYFTVRKGDGVKARRLMRVFVKPEADRVLWLHVRVLLVLNQGKARSLTEAACQQRQPWLLLKINALFPLRNVAL